jgi:protein NirF
MRFEGRLLHCVVVLLLLFPAGQVVAGELRGTGDLGIIIERAAGAVQIVDTTEKKALSRVEGLGDLSHASAVFSRDERYAFIFGRDGGLTKLDLLTSKVVKRIEQAGNAIGGAISEDGELIAVSNYEPGGVRVFRSDDLEPVAEIPTGGKVVGLVDAPGNRFVFSLYDGGEIWIADFSQPGGRDLRKFPDIGQQPYDALITSDGRYYVAGLFGEDGLVLLDLWHPEDGAKRILDGYGRGEEPLPVYKMPHLEGWARAGGLFFLPAVGRHELLVLEEESWREKARIPLHGQPVFAVANPDGRHVWVNFAHPKNDVVQIIDVESFEVVDTLRPGKAVLHMSSTPRGEQVWISVRDEDRVDVYDTRTRERIARLPMDKPSGIFFTARAHRIGL